MSSSQAEPRSIATQLVLLFTLCAALLLSCSLGVFYWIVVQHAVDEDNAVLAQKADALATAFEKLGGINALADDINKPGGIERTTFPIRVLDPTGATIAETSGMAALLPTEIFPLAAS